MSKKMMVDVVINIDSLILDNGLTVDDVIDHIKDKFEMGYEPTWEILYEETIDD